MTLNGGRLNAGRPHLSTPTFLGRHSLVAPESDAVWTDNLGYGELGVYGGGIPRAAPTPRIDTLASQGGSLPSVAIAVTLEDQPSHPFHSRNETM
jgi:hypothetical protein